MRTLRRNVLDFAIIASLVFASSACTVTKPEILELTWQIHHRHDIQERTKTEELSFWVHVNDEDGDDDIESVYIIHDGSELFWRLQADSWERTTIGEELWFGHSGLRMYRDGLFPRGTYRVMVVDRAGERAESTLYVSSDRIPPEDTEYPVLSIKDGEISVASPTERLTLWFYDGAAAVVKLFPTTSTQIPISSALSRPEQDIAVGLAVYIYDNDSGIGAITGIYALE